MDTVASATSAAHSSHEVTFYEETSQSQGHTDLAVLTVMLLTFVGGTAFAAKQIFAQPQQAPAADIAQQTIPAAPAQEAGLQTANAAPADTSNDQIIAAYQAQLEQAYQALDEAYAQIDTLQAAQRRRLHNPSSARTSTRTRTIPQ